MNGDDGFSVSGVAAGDKSADLRARLETTSEAHRFGLGLLGAAVLAMVGVASILPSALLFASIEHVPTVDLVLGGMTVVAVWSISRRTPAVARFLASGALDDAATAARAVNRAAMISMATATTSVVAGFVTAINIGDPMTMVPYAILGGLVAVSGRPPSIP